MICGVDCAMYLEAGRCFFAPGGYTSYFKECDNLKCFRKKEDTVVKENTKVCRKCGRRLPLSEFPVSEKSHDGHIHTCRECHRAAKKAAADKWWEAHRGALAAKVKGAELTDEELFAELRRRGWSGELTKTDKATL